MGRPLEEAEVRELRAKFMPEPPDDLSEIERLRFRLAGKIDWCEWLEARWVAQRDALREIHDHVCGCAAPGRLDTCVFTALAAARAVTQYMAAGGETEALVSERDLLAARKKIIDSAAAGGETETP